MIERRDYLLQVEGPGIRPCVTCLGTWLECQHCALPCILPRRPTPAPIEPEPERQRASRRHVYPKDRKRRVVE